MIKKLYWKLRIIKLSLGWCWKINLGDLVWYRGKKYPVVNGARPESWRLAYLNNEDDGWVKRFECGKVWTLENIVGSFKSGYRFYMGYWYNIWIREGVKDWMKSLPIW